MQKWNDQDADNTSAPLNRYPIYQFASLAAFQRLGYIAEAILENQEQADALFQRLRDAHLHFRWAALSRQKPAGDTMPRSSRWKVIVNTNIEVDDL